MEYKLSDLIKNFDKNFCFWLSQKIKDDNELEFSSTLKEYGYDLAGLHKGDILWVDDLYQDDMHPTRSTILRYCLLARAKELDCRLFFIDTLVPGSCFQLS